MRVFLGGRDVPRVEFALEGIGESSGVPVVLLLEDGEVFVPEDYISLGYTNYEVWCVGAVGGRGGIAADPADIWWLVERSTEVMPDWAWAEEINYARVLDAANSEWTYENYLNIGDTHLIAHGKWATFTVSATPPPAGVRTWDVFWAPWVGRWVVHVNVNAEGYVWLTNPDRIVEVVSYLEPVIQPGGLSGTKNMYVGGGGGGGGLHVVRGLLTDLPAEVIAEVGQAGADGAIGQYQQPAPWDPSPTYDTRTGFDWDLSGARWNLENRFPNGHPTIGAPGEGSPGGASAFGDICKASGGKGGKPAIQWAGSLRQLYAYGGEGGTGNTDIPGGGADGAITGNAAGKDGGWNGDVGSGGGGGRGGSRVSGLIVGATEGGRGALNYADTSVYGARGPLGTYLRNIRNYTHVVGETNWFEEPEIFIDPMTGQPLDPKISAAINPGSGGGARIPGARKYGSRALGYSHDGAVLVRLYKTN
jgi:hypothetical protein